MTGWDEIGPGVWTRRYDRLSLRAGVVAGDGGVLVVDTRSHAGEAAELAAHIRELGAGPVRWVVNTHHHWDHVFGNAGFRPAPIWGHVRCAGYLRDRGEEMRAAVAGYAPEIADVQIVPPDRVFADSAVVDLGTRRVELRYLGRGHTDDDVVVVVPDAGVLFAGDLVEHGDPPAFEDGFPLDWPDTLDALLDLVAGQVVPGHGEVVDRGFVAAQRDDIAAAAQLARDCHAAGTPLPADAPFPPAVMQVVLRRTAAQLAGEAA